jgi:TolB-like protein/DNA-binding winged helix-turn-helix (wHTH) protein
MPPPFKGRFGPFEFDAASGELTRDGRRVPLQRQPSRLLELLLAKPGEVVAREEIRLALWGEDTHVDFERSLNFCVAKLRAALRDSAGDPQFIETLPTRGYRFIADVATDRDVGPGFSRATKRFSRATKGTAEAVPYNSQATEGTAQAVPYNSQATEGTAQAVPDTRPLRPWVIATALAIAAVIALRVFVDIRPGVPKVVVVPFKNETGAPELDRLAKGVSDATVARLAESDRVRVIGNAAGLTLSFRPRDMKAIGESLGAEYLVLGQMKKDDRHMRIVAHLIRVSDQTHVWAWTYDTVMLDLAEQASIAEAIAKAVALRVRNS